MNERRVLVPLWDGGGVVPPILHVVKKLVDRGHAVLVQSDPTIGPEAHAAGAEFTPWRRAPHRTTRDRDADILRDYAAKNMNEHLGALGRYFYEAGEDWTADVLAAADEHRADLLLGDSMIPWTALAADVRGLPCGMLHTMPYSIPTPGMTPSGAAMLPLPGWLAPPRDAFLRWVTEWVFDKFLAHVNRVRATYGRAPVAHTLDQVRSADLQIVLGSRLFDFDGRGAPPKVVWTGPQLADPAWCAPWTAPWAPGDARPLVLVGLSSTYQAQIPLLRRIVEALAALPVRAVLTTGPSLRDGEVTGADNVWVVPSAPHAQLLREASLLVMHAGHGITMKGLMSGVPMVCVPMGRDQGDNAARVIALGAGVKLGPKATAPQLGATIARALASEPLAVAARRAAARFAERAGEVDVVEVAERLGAAPPPRARRHATG